MDIKAGTLYLVSTPIGNLGDITSRAVEILNKVDVCAAEDTRKSKVLFNAYEIKTKLTSYHKFSEKAKAPSLIKRIKNGEDVALISDAGTPLISDPGRHLVNEAVKNDILVVPIPGVSSVVAALSVSGFNLDNFSFYGFPSRKNKERKTLIDKICKSSGTSVFFESGKRIEDFLRDLSQSLPDKAEVLIAREITKLHETFYRGNITAVINKIGSSKFGEKGEFVIVVSGSTRNTDNQFSDEDKRVLNILINSVGKKEALSIASKILNKKRNLLYKIALEEQ